MRDNFQRTLVTFPLIDRGVVIYITKRIEFVGNPHVRQLVPLQHQVDNLVGLSASFFVFVFVFVFLLIVVLLFLFVLYGVF